MVVATSAMAIATINKLKNCVFTVEFYLDKFCFGLQEINKDTHELVLHVKLHCGSLKMPSNPRTHEAVCQ